MTQVATEANSAGIEGFVGGPSVVAPAKQAMLIEAPVAVIEATGLMPAERAVRLRAIPFAFAGKRLRVAMADIEDDAAADEVSLLSRRPIERVAISPEAYATLARAAYGTTAEQMASRLADDEEPDAGASNLEAVEAEDLHRMAEQPSLINLVNLILVEAVRLRASDVHVEPFERTLVVKYRVDGMLIAQPSPPKHLQAAITSRIKIMSGMNIAERYAPQDGHITLRYEGRKIDVRVSTAPTIYGESVVMRILDKEAVNLDLVALGMREPDRAAIQKLIDLPHGMVLVTGPTGSGKTTTLYAALAKLYDPSLKIITIEDPVEYELHGVNQIPVNPKRGLSFASGLRSILRQDPDVIMVGEIRDAETAEISVRAALTGHLLFSTLHTNNAISSIGRLLDMGIEPFLLSSVIEGIMAQRLGRRICAECKVREPIADATRHRLSHAEQAMFVDGLAYRGKGCDRCGNTGMRGRVGYYEVALMNHAMREGIAARASTRTLMKAAGPDFVSMRRDGLIKAAEGSTTIEQVLGATQDADEPVG